MTPGSGDAASFAWVIRTSVGVEPEAVRLSAIHDRPDIVGDEPSDSYPIDGKELFPVVLKDFVECEPVSGECLHGLGL